MQEVGRNGGGGHVDGKVGVRGWMTKRCLLSLKIMPLGEYSIISLVASFQLSKNTEGNLGQSWNTLRHTKQCQDQKYVSICFFRA